MTEKIIEKTILTWLNHQPNIFAFKVNTTGIFDPVRKVFRTIKNNHIHKGTADILGVMTGRFFAIEVKTKITLKKAEKNPTQHDMEQSIFLDKVRKRGGYATRVASLEDVIEFIFNVQKDIQKTDVRSPFFAFEKSSLDHL